MDDPCCLATLEASWATVSAADIALYGGDPIKITISATPPLIRTRFTEALRCPHGITFWIEPSAEQRAAWEASDG